MPFFISTVSEQRAPLLGYIYFEFLFLLFSFSSSAFCKFMFIAFFWCHRPAQMREGASTNHQEDFWSVQVPVATHMSPGPPQGSSRCCGFSQDLRPTHTTREFPPSPPPAAHLPRSSVVLPCQCSKSLTDFSSTSGV